MTAMTEEEFQTEGQKVLNMGEKHRVCLRGLVSLQCCAGR